MHYNTQLDKHSVNRSYNNFAMFNALANTINTSVIQDIKSVSFHHYFYYHTDHLVLESKFTIKTIYGINWLKSQTSS